MPCHPQGGHCPACFAETLTYSYGKRLPTSAAPIHVQSIKLSNKKGRKKGRKKYVCCHPPAEVLAQYLGNSEQMRPYKLSNLTDQSHHFHCSQYQTPEVVNIKFRPCAERDIRQIVPGRDILPSTHSSQLRCKFIFRMISGNRVLVRESSEPFSL